MKHLFLAIVLLASLTAAQNVRVEQLLNQAKQYYEVSENIEELQKFVEDIIADPKKGAEEILDELDQAGDSIVQSIQFAQVQRNQPNSTYVNNTNSTSNYTYPNNTYYNYSTNPRGYSQVSNYTNNTYPTNYTNYTNQSYPSNYTYSSYPYPATYSYAYDTTTNQNISSSNSTYPNSTYQNYTDTNSTCSNYTDTNSTYSNYTDTNSTYQNYTDTNSTYQNYTNYNNTRRERVEQKINLKLRKQLNLSGIHNYTQNVTYYNPYRQQYEYIVLFNETNTASTKRPNEYYYYENNTLITLEREYDYYGNVVYRNLTLDYKLVVTQQYGDYNYNGNTNAFGTLVIGNGNVNGTYYKNGFAYYNNYNYGQYYSSQYGSNNQVTNASFNYNNGSTYVNGNRDRSGYDSYQTSGYQSNATLDVFNSTYDTNSYDNQQQVSAYRDRQYNYSNVFLNNNDTNYQYSSNSQNIYGDNLTMTASQSQSNEYSNGNSRSIYDNNGGISTSNTQSYNSQSQNQQSNSLYGNNYQIGNSTSFNQDYSYSNSQQNSNSTTGDYASDSSSSNYQIRTNYGNSTYARNNTNYISNSDTYINSAQGNSASYNYTYDNQPYYQYSNSNYQNNYNQTHEVTTQDNTTQTVDATLDASQYNYNSYQYGDQDPTSSATGSNTHSSYTTQTNVQQFNSLRGSKKTTGSWKQLDVQELLNSNSQIVEQAIQAVNDKYQPVQDGFEFDSVLSVKEQIVSGINSAIDLQYTNADGDSRIYQVIIYSAPWTNKPDQVLSCLRVSEQDQ